MAKPTSSLTAFWPWCADMFLINSSSAHHTAMMKADHMTRAQARIVRNGQVETFNVALISTDNAELEQSVDTLEAKIGTVLSLHEIDVDGTVGKRLYKSMFEAWEVV